MPRSFQLLGLGGLLLAVAAPMSVLAEQRQIEVEPPNIKDPIMITRVTVGEYEVQCHLFGPPGGPVFQPITPFGWTDDWLDHVEIHLFNRTNKTIVFGRIDLAFPETKTGPTAPTVVSSLDFGIVPANDFLSNGQPFPRSANEHPVAFSPGGTLVLHVGDYTNSFRPGLESVMPNRAPTQILIQKGSIFFSDGMRWLWNRYSVPDPEHPGQWVRQDPWYFPGDSENNWPVPAHKVRRR